MKAYDSKKRHHNTQKTPFTFLTIDTRYQKNQIIPIHHLQDQAKNAEFVWKEKKKEESSNLANVLDQFSTLMRSV